MHGDKWAVGAVRWQGGLWVWCGFALWDRGSPRAGREETSSIVTLEPLYGTYIRLDGLRWVQIPRQVHKADVTTLRGFRLGGNLVGYRNRPLVISLETNEDCLKAESNPIAADNWTPMGELS